jgi:molecular chaperone DnaK (HSP70)
MTKGIDVRGDKKALGRLRAQCEKAKRMLSTTM